MTYLDDQDDDTNLVKDLRKQLREALKAKDTAEGRVTELEGTVRARSVEEVLTSKSVDKRIAKFIPPDVKDEAGVTAWLAENGELFGVTKVDEPDAEGVDIEAARRTQAAASGSSGTPDRQQQQLDAVRKATTKEELDALVFGARQ